MPMLEDVKKTAEKVMGWSRPKRSALSGLIRPLQGQHVPVQG